MRAFVYVIGAVAIVVVSFMATLRVLDYWSGPPLPALVTEETPASQLPKFSGSNFGWAAATGLNLQTLKQTLPGSNQPIIQLIAVPADKPHMLNGVAQGLQPGHTYRIKAWVQSIAGGNIQMQVSGGDQQHFGATGFDFAARKLAFTSGTGAGASADATGGAQIWLDLPTANGQFNVVLVLIQNSTNLFKGDGKAGASLGGLTIEALN